MEQLHRETRRILVASRTQLETLEAACANTELHPAASAAVSTSFRENVMRLGANASSLRRLVSGEPPSRREVWRARLRDLEEQVGELRAGEARCAMRFRRLENERVMREELLRRRGLHHGGGGGGGDAVIGMRTGAQENSGALERSANVVTGILETGQGAMERLMGQKGRLRKVKRRMLDVMNGIGVDRRIIASIERREYSDVMLLYGLMLVMVVLLGMAVLWKYERKK